MRKRTIAREFALQALYQMDICRDNAETVLADFWFSEEKQGAQEEVRQFTSELVKGTESNLAQIDAAIMRYAANWELERMACLDRNILRLASFELMFREDIPPKVSINEAVELAKKYSGPEAGKFVNGILDKIKAEMKR